MPEREMKKKTAPQRTEEVEAEEVAPSESGSKIKAELDDLLDEIDEVLETNAEDFVKSYIQKGGE
ncbi:MAG: ubiquitin-like protein Pup [Acidimicrobiales bacterium]